MRTKIQQITACRG